MSAPTHDSPTSDLSALRSTLHAHADLAQDHGSVERTTSVHARVRHVRQRRRAAGAGVLAALVVAAVVGVGLRPSSPVQPAAPMILGVQAPATFTSLGYTYAYDDSAAGEGTATLDLPTTRDPVLLTWVTRGADDDVRLRVTGGEQVLRSSAGDFADFTVVRPVEGARVRLRGAGGVAVAAYRLTDQAPPGVTAHGTTFRREVADLTLVGAAIAEPGQGAASFTATMPDGPLMIASLCTGGSGGSRVQVSLDGEVRSFGRTGCRDSSFDPGAGGGFTVSPSKDLPVGSTLRVQVSTTDRDPDVLVGIGAYLAAGPTTRAAGQPVPEVLEHDGHRWVLSDVVSSTGAASAPVTATEESLVRVAFSSAGRVSVHTEAGNKVLGPFISNRDGSGSYEPGTVAAGQRVVARGRGADADRTRYAVALYVRE